MTRMPRSNNSDARDMLELEELSNSYDLAMTERDIEARVAVLIPCYNEELTIPNVVRDFRRALPEAVVYVYDNNSRDRTCDVARTAGAVIGFENMQGKGNVIRRMFADVEADIYVIVDGDDTYDAGAAPRLVSLLWDNQLDMVNAQRLSDERNAYRAGHRIWQ